MDMEVFCALTNSNIKFLSAARSLIDKVKGINILSEEEILTSLSYNTLMRNFALISNSAYQRIEQITVV